MKTKTIVEFKKDEILDIEKVVESYNSYIYKILKNEISNESDIEEILSDVFVIFWKNYKKLDTNIPIKPYLIGIVKNLMKKKYREYKMDIQNIEQYEDEIIYDIDIEKSVENKEKYQIILNSLSKIKEADKKIFMMFYYQQKKIKDISQMLKISEAKVKISLYRTRKFIKKNLKERGYSYGE